MSKAAEAKAGDIIADRYRLEEAIGKGGVGIVFRASDQKLAREVAVKVLLPQYAAQEELRIRFVREAKVTARLAHRGAVRLYDFGDADGQLFLVMELLAGSTLRELIEQGPIGPDEVVEIALQIADVLVSAHALPLVHRDLKPDNIMLEELEGGRQVKVLDYGMAFIADEERAEKDNVGRLTQQGISGGTPAYMAPEQIQGAELTGAADIYAFGCVLFEMLSGSLPFEGPMMKLLTKHMYQPVPELRPLCPDAPQALIELVDRMMAKKPGDRPSAETVRKRLEALEPLTTGTRERSRGPVFLSTREARMVSAPELEPPAIEAPPSDLSVHVLGSLDDDVTLALAATSIALVEAGAAADVVFVAEPRAADELVATCTEAAVPVVVASDNLSIEVVSELMRAGVAEIVDWPIRADELTRKLRRAARKKR